MGLLVEYPVVADLHERGQFYGSAEHLRAPLPPLPSPQLMSTELQQLRDTPIGDNKDLENLSKILVKYFVYIEEKLPHTFDTPIGTIEIEIGILKVDFVAQSGKPLSNHQSLPKMEARESASNTTQKADPIPIKTVKDALAYFNFAALHSSRLIELISTAETIAGLSEEIEKWRKLKETLIQFSKIVDKILQKYKGWSLDCPEVKDLQKIKRNIVKVISGISIEQFQQFLGQKQLEFSEDELFISALGLNGKVARKLACISQDARCHQTDLYYLKDIVCQEIEEQCRKDDPDLQISDILIRSGFTVAKAELLAEDFKNNVLFSHQPLEYFVNCYFEFMFEYDVFLNTHCPRFPLQEKKINEWIDVDATRVDTDDEETTLEIKIPIFNSSTWDVRRITKNDAPFFPAEIEAGVWYHATDHSSAESILTDGIDLSKGRPKQDFSDGNGFYLTPHLKFALDWAKQKGVRSKGAVIMFKYNIDGNNYRGLDLTLDSDNVWSDVVKFYRSGKSSKFIRPSRQLIKTLKSSDFIEGPMSGDQTKCHIPSWTPTKKEGEDAIQLCITTQALADDFSQHIEGIVFMSANEI